MPQEHNFNFKVSEDDKDVAYLKLPGHPGTKQGVVKRTLNLRDLVGDYQGPEINLDFVEKNTIIGIEIIG